MCMLAVCMKYMYVDNKRIDREMLFNINQITIINTIDRYVQVLLEKEGNHSSHFSNRRWRNREIQSTQSKITLKTDWAENFDPSV